MINKKIVMNILGDSPVIAAVHNLEDIESVIELPIQTVFILGSSILELPEYVEILREHKKNIFIHIDLLQGIGKDAAGVKFIAKKIKPHGLISTRSNLLKFGSEEGLITIQRMFLVDSTSFQSGIKMIHASQPDLVEMMPGLVPKAITKLKSEIHQPIIAGGMITCKDDIINALKAGAIAVSTSKRELWTV